MMIGPESYYESYIKGKSKEEVDKEIEKLKEQIKELEQLIKDGTPSIFISPSFDVRLSMYKKYLEYTLAAQNKENV